MKKAFLAIAVQLARHCEPRQRRGNLLNLALSNRCSISSNNLVCGTAMVLSPILVRKRISSRDV